MEADTPFDQEQSTMELFLRRAIVAITKEIHTKKLARLRESCSTTLELVKKHGVTAKEEDQESTEQVDKVLNKLIITLGLACKSKQPKIMSTALDCLQKLMAYGFIRETIKDIENPERKLMDKVIETIGSCFDCNDDEVQIQIIKAFLTAVSSPICEIHELTLMNTIRACFNIFLISRNPVNQMTAKATLSQMLSIIFQRLETISLQVLGDSESVAEANEKIRLDLSNAMERKVDNDDVKPAELKGRENEDAEDIKEANEMSAQQFLSLPEDSTMGELERTELSVAYVDCFLSFRALCKLSMKELSPTDPPESIDMRRKLLALELIQNILENAGPMLCKNVQFINTAIRKYLFVSILVNGVSPFIKIFRVSLHVFSALIEQFRDNLKNEIGVIFAKILLRIIGSSDSSLQHKHAVLVLLQSVCKEAQTLVDIFLNYDCHLEFVDIFERMVNEVSSIAKSVARKDASPLAIQQSNRVRFLALDCLVTIMRSLVHWSTELLDEEKHHDKENKDHPIPLALEEGEGSTSSLNHSATDLSALDSGGGSSGSGGVPGSPSPVDSFTQQKERKYRIEKGKTLFNDNPRKGIAYLIEVGHIKNTAKDVASFLLHSEDLDLNQIGQYLGRISDPFCKNVLYEYVDLQCFSNMEIYTALRRFLLGFRLPGEGGQIDVIMEKFAERYYTDNKAQSTDPDTEEEVIFANADAVYVFAYHMIMLATDLHHHAVKNKISREEWVNNNRDLNDGNDFPSEFLLSIYETVLKFPLKTRDDPPLGATGSTELMTPKQRQILFLKETKSIVQRSQDMIDEKLEDTSTFFKSTNIEHVKPMFSISWCPMLAAFSMNLEKSLENEHDVYALCLEGFRCAIHISSIFFMEIEQNAFVSSLYQFTLLSNLREMKLKNIEAIKCLIQVAHEDGNYLQGSWTQVLNCITQLAKIQILGSSMRHTEQVAMSSAPTSLSDTNKIVSLSASNTPLNLMGDDFEGMNASAIVDHIDLAEIDRIFVNTVHLHDNAIVEFVRCLCNVSLVEVNSPEPRTFSLQKLIEVAYYNMERIRFVWTRIWGIMADHFIEVGCHKNLQVAMYAVDSLRQLAMKFLEKDELSNYHFQKDFLKPFEYIVSHNRNTQIRELVVRCLSQMILARADNIRSGWKSIFMVFTFVATHSQQAIVFLSFLMLDRIITEYFHLISTTFFVECVECLKSFASNRHFKEVGIKAVESIGFCAKQLAEGKVFPLSPLEEGRSEQVFSTEEKHLLYWLPIFHGLSDIVSHPNIDVRTSALDRFFNILLKYGHLFHPTLWHFIYHQVFLNLFSDVRATCAKFQGKLQHTGEWVTTTCLGTFSHMGDMISFFFDDINFLAEDFLVLLASFILQENFHLSSIGSTCLKQFIMANGEKWSQEQWTFVCTTLQYVVTEKRCIKLLSIGSAPKKENGEEGNVLMTPQTPEKKEPSPATSFYAKLLAATPPIHRPLDVKVVVGKCTVQLLLLKTVQEVSDTFFDSINNDNFTLLLNALDVNYSFAKTLNSKADVWKAAGKSEIMSLMVQQESWCAKIYLDILLRLFTSSTADRRELAQIDLLARLSSLMNEFVDVNDNSQKYPPIYSASKLPILLQAIEGFANFDERQFVQHLPELYPNLCDLILMNDTHVRDAVQNVLARVGKLHQFSK